MQRYKKLKQSALAATRNCKKGLLLALLLFASLSLSAQSANPPVTFDRSSSSIIQAFRQIEQQTGLRVVYEGTINTAREVALPKGRLSLTDALGVILKDTGIGYRIIGQFIYVDSSGSVTTAPRPTTQSPPAPAFHAFSGEVRDARDGKLLEGVTVTLSGERRDQVSTDYNGRFYFDHLPAGTYQISASCAGYSPNQIFEIVSEGNTLYRVSLALTPVPVAAPAAEGLPIPIAPAVSAPTAQNRVHPSYEVAENLRTANPDVAIKLNLLSAATTTLNAGVEINLGHKLTLDLPVSFNAWAFGDKKWKHLIFQPELRLWPCDVFNRHFFGFHLHGGIYNVGGLAEPPFSSYMNQHRFEGWLVGAGVSYGYHWILNNRWALEATVGVGYAYLNYDTYRCENCGQQLGSDQVKNYFGPTRAGISLIYIIK